MYKGERMCDELLMCPECDVEIEVNEKNLVGVCPKCKASFELGPEVVEEFKEDITEETKPTEQEEVEEVEEIEEVEALQKAKEESEQQEEIQEEQQEEEEVKEDQEEPEEVKEVKEKKEPEYVEGTKDKEDKNQLAIDIIDQTFIGDEKIVKDIHGSYVSWYSTHDAKNKKGKRFLVAYRNGRKLKVQFFNGIIPPSSNEYVTEIKPNGKVAYEYKSDDLKDFGELIEQTFRG